MQARFGSLLIAATINPPKLTMLGNRSRERFDAARHVRGLESDCMECKVIEVNSAMEVFIRRGELDA